MCEKVLGQNFIQFVCKNILLLFNTLSSSIENKASDVIGGLLILADNSTYTKFSASKVKSLFAITFGISICKLSIQ